MDGMDYDPMMMDGDSEMPQVKISAVRKDPSSREAAALGLQGDLTA